MKAVVLLLALSFFCNCKKRGMVQPPYQCKLHSLQKNLTRLSLLGQFEDSILQGLAAANAPSNDGALNRNKSGYFHVRFQMGIAPLADYAVDSRSTNALEATVKAIEYSFQYQEPNGNFKMIIPAGVSGPPPTVTDSASGVAFFLSGLGTALITLEQSDWYQSPQVANYKNRIERLRPQAALALDWLMSKKAILENGDRNAPNRLFFDALACYSMGKWLNHAPAQAVGLNFAQLAMNKKSAQGYFLEGDSWDSSYQGVGLAVGFTLFSLLDSSESVRPALWEALSCGVDWQKSRVSAAGEISLQGNTRVYAGGETFLGQEKQIAWKDSMLSFFMMSYYSSQPGFYQTALNLLRFYS